MRVESHPDADQELLDAADWLNERRPGYGMQFRADFIELLNLLTRYPEIGPQVSRRARKKRLLGYRYDVIYQILDDVLYIVAIAHQSRRPTYWRSRLRK